MPTIAHGVILIGFMGSGKSTVALELARLSGMTVLDLDTLIVARAGCSIAEIFRRDGEAHFRQLESEALAALDPATPAIVATGGGVVGRPENWELMRRLGSIVYLRARWDTLRGRLQGTSGRPLAAAENGWEPVEALLQQRLPLYAQADLTVDTDTLTPEGVARIILERLG